MKCGDQNTRFFHALTTQRQRKNRIEGLRDPNGVWREDQEGIEQVILDYFLEIFSTEQLSIDEASLDAVTPKISLEMNNKLMGEFRVDEF